MRHVAFVNAINVKQEAVDRHLFPEARATVL